MQQRIKVSEIDNIVITDDNGNELAQLQRTPRGDRLRLDVTPYGDNAKPERRDDGRLVVYIEQRPARARGDSEPDGAECVGDGQCPSCGSRGLTDVTAMGADRQTLVCETCQRELQGAAV